jgi:hypothetical protein
MIWFCSFLLWPNTAKMADNWYVPIWIMDRELAKIMLKTAPALMRLNHKNLLSCITFTIKKLDYKNTNDNNKC